MMLASELPYVLKQINVKEVKGDVYTIDKYGKKIVLDYIYVDDAGDLIFTEHNMKLSPDELNQKLKGESNED